MGVIIFNGTSSADLNVEVETPPKYIIPERDYDITHVPGRNGDLVLDTGSFQNVERTYSINVLGKNGNYTEAASRVMSWLHSSVGYARLEDSYEPEYYREAIYKDNLEMENLFMEAGKADISFNCKPQRFLKMGEYPVHFTLTGAINNPTRFNSLPIIYINGSGAGSVSVGDDLITISEIGTTTVIDSDLQDAYYDTENRNAYVTMDDFPKLEPGFNEVSFTGGVTSVSIIPRWWTL